MLDSKLDELVESKEFLCEILLEQTKLLDGIIGDLSDDNLELCSEDKIKRDTIVLMLQALGVSTHSILKLTSSIDMAIRDCFGIARSISELAVNIAYIVASPPSIALSAQQHAMQKSYRDLSRNGDIGGSQISLKRSGIPPIDSIPGLELALAAYTDKKGREKRNWVDLNIDNRIKCVNSLSERAAICLSGSVFAVYRHSSEFLHGTYFGGVFFWTDDTKKISTKADFESLWLSKHFNSIFTAVFFGIAGVIDACSKVFPLQKYAQYQLQLEMKAKKLVLEM